MFGFTENEMKELLAIRGMDPSKGMDLRDYYNGYEAFWYPDKSRSVKLYNPWSVMKAIRSSYVLNIRSHWTDTGGAAHFIMSHLFTKLDGSDRSKVLDGIVAMASWFHRLEAAKITHGEAPFSCLEDLLENDRVNGRFPEQPGDSVRTLEQRQTPPISVIYEPIGDILFSDLGCPNDGAHGASPVPSTLFAYLYYAGYLVGRPIVGSLEPAISKSSLSTVESNNEESVLTELSVKRTASINPMMETTATKKLNDSVRIVNMQYYIPNRDVLAAWERWMKDSVRHLEQLLGIETDFGKPILADKMLDFGSKLCRLLGCLKFRRHFTEDEYRSAVLFVLQASLVEKFAVFGEPESGGVLLLPLKTELKVGYVIEIKNGPVNASVPLEGVNERGSASGGESSELLRNRTYLSCFLTSSVTSVQDISLVCSPQKVAFVAKRWLPNANRTDFLLSPAAAVCVGVDTCDVDF